MSKFEMASFSPLPSKRHALTSMTSSRSRVFKFPSILALFFILNQSSTVVNALNIAVTGATGRIGRLVVDRCLKSGHDVTAIVRDVDKANELLSECATGSSNDVTIRQLDFADLTTSENTSKLVGDAFDGVERVIWCASGFVDVPGEGTEGDEGGDNVETKKELLDVVALTHLLPSLSSLSSMSGGASQESDVASPSPSFVMLSSAGVTRPGWDEAKKEKFVGCADIPIVRMNPGGVLGKKVVAEDLLRQVDNSIPYCVVRPTGLKFEDDEWPRGRTVFSQGDVAVGRMNANDLASVLVDMTTEPSATGKTFECVTVANYPPPKSLSPVLDQLEKDDVINLDGESVYTSYRLMQQLLPGENQDGTRLEMGRTYEQVDSGEVAARTRGAAPTEREKEIAGGVVYETEKKNGFRSKIGKIFRRS